MVADVHEQASKEFGAEAMLRLRWKKAFETPLNAILGKIQAVFRAMFVRDGYFRDVEPFHSELSNYEAAQIAKQEWLWALAYFHEVSEPGLVDYAVYSLQAAERKYMYLLEKAREEYVSVT